MAPSSPGEITRLANVPFRTDYPTHTPSRAETATTVYANETVRLEAIVTGTPPLSFQWQHHGTNLPGATESQLILDNVQPALAGRYQLLISNAAGTAVSIPVELVVNSVPGLFHWTTWIYVPPPTDLDDVVAVAGGTSHFLALRSDGTVVAWGANTASQSIVPPHLRHVVTVSAGREHTLALIADQPVIPPTLVPLNDEPAHPRFQYQTALGWYDTVEWTSDLCHPTWHATTPRAGDGSIDTFSLRLINTPPLTRYYRVRRWQP